jgi:folate-dependent phosphoribosylglycinamide formyltransferase PurN
MNPEHSRRSTGPIRVVMFGGGPVLEPDVEEFLVRLEAQPEIELLGAFCQAAGPRGLRRLAAITADLWRRRRLVALPLLAFQVGGWLQRHVVHIRRQRARSRQLVQLQDRIHYVPDIHAPAVLDQVAALAPDLGLVYGSPILKPALFEIPRCGALGIHHGRVPAYRGKKTTFWAMYNGEVDAGVTIQKINAGLDTGEIVKEGAVPIGGRSYRAVWRDLQALGLDLYIEAILAVRAGAAAYRPQSGPKGKLYRDPTIGDLWRFWWRV